VVVVLLLLVVVVVVVVWVGVRPALDCGALCTTVLKTAS